MTTAGCDQAEALDFASWLKQDQTNRAWRRLYSELVYRTVRDAHDYGSGKSHRFKACGGARGWNPAATMKRANSRLVEWVETDTFARCLESLRIDPEKGQVLIKNLIAGDDLDRVADLLKQMNHETRIADTRGPASGFTRAKRQNNTESRACPP